MAKKLMAWKTKGMNRDLSVSAFNPEFAFENRNLRLGTNESNTLMSWVNERGTKRINIVRGKWNPENEERTTVTEITGTPIGTAVINHQLVVFTTDTLHDYDYIYVLKYADSAKESMLCKMLFGGENLSLGFRVDHPLETLVSYESEKIQKVYWTDGINQPRVINIEGKIRENNIHQFDFVPTLQLQEKVSVKKVLGANGMFAPGVIQYALTYYNKFGQESNIFYTSPLLYISYRDRGASPEDKVENAFKISVSGVDVAFDYLRIYSIQRTSIDATPICKRVQDVSLSDLEETEEGSGVYKVSYIDTGMTGDNIDPTELLYKGGEVISAETLEQKDNTLFMGNISITRPQITSTLAKSIRDHATVEQSKRYINATSVSTGSYIYASQLTAYAEDNETSVPCAGFKFGDKYRLGVQFQYKTGKWSDPVWIDDKVIENKPDLSRDNTVIGLPILEGSIGASEVQTLVGEGYKRVRGVVVFPKNQDRNILCQGVVNSTLWTQEHHNNGDLYAQSSWFFRASGGGSVASDKSVSPVCRDYLLYTDRGVAKDSPESGDKAYKPYIPNGSGGVTDYIRQVEIQGHYEDKNKFRVGREIVTFHSPDIEFDEQLWLTDYSNTQYRQTGYAKFSGTLSDIEIQTETPTVSNLGAGFIHKSFKDPGSYGIVSGLFYDDTLVEDWNEYGEEKNAITAFKRMKASAKWLVYLWNKTGSLNNDINRPANKGTQSSKLKKKVISNLRYANTTYDDVIGGNRNYVNFPRIFSSDQSTIIKLEDKIYMGNVDTSLLPDKSDGMYFAFEADRFMHVIFGMPPKVVLNDVNTDFTSNKWWKTFNTDDEETSEQGLYLYSNTDAKWNRLTEDEADSVGNQYLDLVIKKESVRMKYKSTPHIVFSQDGDIDWLDTTYAVEHGKGDSLPVIEIINPWDAESDINVRFGGRTADAFKENIWLPCGEPKSLLSPNENGKVEFKWEYGDTYFQRWDCLKTYAFTPEDQNQVVEIGSFMLETRVNIDGRYDKNRGQVNNLNVSPINFNLLNPVYSQKDNFFQYRIQDDFFYTDVTYPNQITWSKAKSSGADIDLWTNVTLASSLEMDGNKGEVTSIQRFNDQLICFQNSGISQILYNGNVMIESTQGVPIEIANSGKVQGKSYYSDTIGCSNKWSIQSGAMGLYFMDSDGKNIHLFNGQLVNLSTQQGFSSWAKLYIPSNDWKWTPTFPENYDKSAFVSYYDKMNQEILFINHSLCLAFSEKFGVFTSFYDYHNTPFFCNLDDTGIWLRANQLWKHQAGDYCKFFGASRPYSMVLVGNPEPTLDKIFTNIEFRACVDNDGTIEDSRFIPYLPFDSLDTWNEYQHGIAYLNNMRGHSAMEHHTSDNEASLKRKFRIWRCDIPRDNGDTVDTFDETFDETFHPIARDKKHPMDRMRNPWLYLRLRKDEESSNRRTEIHDIVMTYFG